MNELFYILSHTVFKTQSAFYAYHTSQSKLATCQGLNRCMWFMATVLDGAALIDLLVQLMKS